MLPLFLNNTHTGCNLRGPVSCCLIQHIIHLMMGFYRFFGIKHIIGLHVICSFSQDFQDFSPFFSRFVDRWTVRLHSTIFYIYQRPCFGFTKLFKRINLRHLWNLGNLWRPILLVIFKFVYLYSCGFCHFYSICLLIIRFFWSAFATQSMC